jgi:predicted HicB family RNase H-like nuclease
MISPSILSNPSASSLMANTMRYKEYIGSVNYDDEDEVFHGKLAFINDSVLFEGSTVEELKRMFHEAVDEYIATCKEMGKEPQRPFRGVFNVRVKPELHQQAAIIAAKKGMPLNQVVAEALSQYVANH